MARSMTADGGYRAVVRIKTLAHNGVSGRLVDAEAINYFGPWDSAATAKGQVTVMRKYYKKNFVDGWIERAQWSRVND